MLTTVGNALKISLAASSLLAVIVAIPLKNPQHEQVDAAIIKSKIGLK